MDKNLSAQPPKLKDKTALITGAGRGIGKAIALTFAHEGANVVVVSRTVSEVEKTASQIRALGGNALSLQVDISKKTDVDKMVHSTLTEFGTIEILVNNAGVIGPIGPLAENPVDSWIDTINVNLIGTVLCCKSVLPEMMKRNKGKIINLSGGGATGPRPNFSAYAVSKSAIVGFTGTLAQELTPFNIQVNAIAPGAIFTYLHEQVLNAGPRAGNNELAVSNGAKQETARSLESAAGLAVFLASDESDGLSGRLISAVWDNWSAMTKEKIHMIMSGELYTLRRIDDVLFGSKKAVA
jgi:3-oxoacyl-[acyl-carrier protein] reductase